MISKPLKFLLSILLVLSSIAAKASPTPIIIDTDLSIDDFQAIAYFLQNPSVSVEAITILNVGQNSCNQDLSQVYKLLQLTDNTNIPTACNNIRNTQYLPPILWRLQMGWFSSAIPGGNATNISPANLIAKVLSSSYTPVTLLSFTGMQHYAAVLQQNPRLFRDKVRRIYFAGGDFLSDKTHIQNYLPNFNNSTATWNVLLDPVSLRQVVQSNVPVYFSSHNAYSVLSMRNVYLALGKNPSYLSDFIRNVISHNMQSWFVASQLAAVLSMQPNLCQWIVHPIKVYDSPQYDGTTRLVPNGPSVHVCLHLSQTMFDAAFLAPFRNP